MKNTKMRKKMLLSSIAMLMVATVSLGSATFAWFKSSPTADAEGFKMKATASNGLKVLSKTEADASGGTLIVGKPSTYKAATVLRAISDEGTIKTNPTSLAMNPVSLNPQADSYDDVFKTVASSDTEKDADTAASVSAATAVSDAALTTGDYYVENVYAALVGAESDTDKADVTITGLTLSLNPNYDMKAGVRVALYYNDVEGASTTTSLIGVYGNRAETSKACLTATGAYAASATGSYDLKVNTSASSWAGAEVDQSGNDYFTVIVYLDGEDDSVYSNAIMPADLITNIKLSLKI